MAVTPSVRMFAHVGRGFEGGFHKSPSKVWGMVKKLNGIQFLLGELGIVVDDW